jgi:hypothetical protein
MLSRIFQLLLVTCLAMGTSRAANDPFVGTALVELFHKNYVTRD